MSDTIAKTRRVGESGNGHASAKAPKCIRVAEGGINTTGDFKSLMGTIIADIATERISPQMGRTMVSAAGTMLRMVDMQRKYNSDGTGRNLLG